MLAQISDPKNTTMGLTKLARQGRRLPNHDARHQFRLDLQKDWTPPTWWEAVHGFRLQPVLRVVVGVRYSGWLGKHIPGSADIT